MNINVIVINGLRDFWPADARTRARDDEHYPRTSSSPQTSAPVEEVIELVPQNGAWTRKREMKGLKLASFSSTVTTYDQKGRIHHTSIDKGLQLNITA